MHHQENFSFTLGGNKKTTAVAESTAKEKSPPPSLAWQLHERQISLGAISWRYPEWKNQIYMREYDSIGRFQREALGEYADQLPCVGVEDTVYGWPAGTAIHTINNCTPDAFRLLFFAPKSAVSFDKKLLFRYEELNREFAKIRDILQSKLCCVILALPDNLPAEKSVVTDFFKQADQLCSSLNWSLFLPAKWHPLIARTPDLQQSFQTLAKQEKFWPCYVLNDKQITIDEQQVVWNSLTKQTTVNLLSGAEPGDKSSQKPALAHNDDALQEIAKSILISPNSAYTLVSRRAGGTAEVPRIITSLLTLLKKRIS